jgi:CheY-like chemotaxis protein
MATIALAVRDTELEADVRRTLEREQHKVLRLWEMVDRLDPEPTDILVIDLADSSQDSQRARRWAVDRLIPLVALSASLRDELVAHGWSARVVDRPIHLAYSPESRPAGQLESQAPAGWPAPLLEAISDVLARGALPVSERASSRGTGDVMIVEDDEQIRSTLAAVLRAEGYAVRVASDGRAALTMLRAGPAPRLILLDLMMPVMNGYELRTELAGDPAFASIPVAVLSAMVPLGAAARRDLGAFMTKPVNLDDLLALVERVLGS